MIETTVDGRYQIIARVAAGGMGEVFRAHDPVLNREVALKMLHASLAGDEDFIDRFRREARAAAGLSHPNIVAVHDWGQAGETYFMVMEFIRGPNLRALLSRGGPLQPAQAADVAAQILSALEHAHAQGIVHRDVKPENVLVTTGGVVKVADFGLARALAESRVTHAPGTVTGTVQYLAPEQIQGEPADRRTDLYATGILLYELLVGKVPFTGETSVAIAYKHLREPVPPPSQANPMVPESFDRIVRAATEKDRERRYPDAAAMRRDLVAALADSPPATPIADVVASLPAKQDTALDTGTSTVTIPRTLSPKAKRRRALRRGMRWMAMLAVLAIAGWAVWQYVIPHRTEVPELIGLELPAAHDRAEEAGLSIVEGGSEFSSTIGAGLIARQTPPVGAGIEKGSAITVFISRGKNLKPVPDVIGDPYPRAREILLEIGFVPDTRRVYSDQFEVNEVVDTDPAPGRDAEVGKEIVVSISKGPEPVAVPAVVGEDVDDAIALLETLGLSVKQTEEFSQEVPRGQVISQAPNEGARLEPGSVVELVVSKGPETFPMPDVIGLTQSAAVARLQALGLRVRIVNISNPQPDRVVGQDPKPDEIVEAGQEVTIYVTSG